MPKLNALLAVFSAVTVAPLLHAQFTASTDLDYSSGKYGQKIRTEIYTYDVSGEYVYKDWTGKIVLPLYENVTGPGGVLPKIGRVGKVNRVIGFTQTKRTNDGFGDVDVSLTYDAYHNDNNGWDISVTGEVKFGTASAAKSLGTGRADYSPSVAVSRTMGKFTPWVSFGYRRVGKPAGFQLRDYWYGSAGVSYAIDDNDSVTVSFDSSERSSLGSDVDNDASIEVSRDLDKSWNVGLTVLAGLSTAAPDIELTGSASYKY
jgi:hypothetical protein